MQQSEQQERPVMASQNRVNIHLNCEASCSVLSLSDSRISSRQSECGLELHKEEASDTLKGSDEVVVRQGECDGRARDYWLPGDAEWKK